MARWMGFEPKTVYRGVVLYRYVNKDSHVAQNPDLYPMKQYYLNDGTVIDYNSSVAYGPYDAPGQAKRQAKEASKVWDQASREYITDPNAVFIAVEEAIIPWTQKERLL